MPTTVWCWLHGFVENYAVLWEVHIPENYSFSIEKYFNFNSFMHMQITIDNPRNGILEVLATQNFPGACPRTPLKFLYSSAPVRF